MGRIIGISGGIGSGKSVVSRILRLMGHSVYDCDLEARRLMETDSLIKARIRDEISAEVTDGVSIPRRDLLASIVFSDETMRRRLNGIVHGAVREDVARCASGAEIIFVEAAILAESGLAAMCDAIWLVEADENDRCRRVMRRDGCTDGQFRSRMESQRREADMLEQYSAKIVRLCNIGGKSLLSEVYNAIDATSAVVGNRL